MWIATHLPRGESGGGGAGVVSLAGALFRLRAEHGGETLTSFGFRDRVGGRRGLRGGIFPVRQLFPDLKGLVRGRRVGLAKRMGDVTAPTPTGFLHAGCEGGGIPVERGIAALGKLVQQRGRKVRQPGDLSFRADRRMVISEGHGHAAWRWRGSLGWADEGKQIQQVEGRGSAHAQPAVGRRSMDQDGWWKGLKKSCSLGSGQQQEFAVQSQDGGATVARDQ